MAGNAHRNRSKRGLMSSQCGPSCMYCTMNGRSARAQGLDWHNSNGHRHNPGRKRRQKRAVR